MSIALKGLLPCPKRALAALSSSVQMTPVMYNMQLSVDESWFNTELIEKQVQLVCNNKTVHTHGL